METLIVICLLIVIVLFLQDKIVTRKKSEQKSKQEKVNPYLPDIMGEPKTVRSFSTLKTEIKQEEIISEINPDDLDIEYDENESARIQIPEEELDEIFGNQLDLEEEEAEWHKYGIFEDNNDFAQGVTFEELSVMGMLLQKETLDLSQKETAVAIVQKIQGTELFSLLENSMEGASGIIGELLNSSLLSEPKVGSSTLRKDDLGNFDIGEFV